MADLKAHKRAIEAEKAKASSAIVSKPLVDAEIPPLKEDGAVWWHLGQRKIWDSDRKILVAIAGKQSGKTIIGPRWLLREIQRTATPINSELDTPNSYLLAGPTLALLKKQAIPYLKRLFKDYGRWDGTNHEFIFSPEGSRRLLGFETEITVICGYGQKPDSLESVTAKAAWLDEAGQDDFKKDSFLNILDRFATTGGRILITTTPYEIGGWFQELVYDKGKIGDPDIELSQYKTRDNPGHNAKVVDDAEKMLPGWKFRLKYEGLFEKPIGAIYDCFDGEFGEEKRHTTRRFPVPNGWKRYWGFDFGPVHTCVTMFAEHPKTKILYLYGCYLPAETGHGRRTYAEHVEKITALTRRYQENPRTDAVMPVQIHGGAKSEKQYLMEYAKNGLRIMPPMFFEVENQIDCVYGALARGEIIVFNDLAGTISEFQSYSHELDEDQEPIQDKIKNKEKYHRLDGVREIISVIRPGIHGEYVNKSSRARETEKKKRSIFDRAV